MNDISLLQILNIFIKRLWIIVLVALIVAGVAFAYNTYYVSPTYLAQSSVLATNGGIVQDDDNNIFTSSTAATSSKIGSSDVSSSLNMLDTYIDILKTYNFYEALSNDPAVSSFGFTPRQLQKATTIERRSENSMFIDVKVQLENPDTAILISNTITELAPKYILSMISNAYVVPADKCISAPLVSPLVVRNTIIAGFAGVIAMIVLFILLEITTNTIKSEEEVAKRYGVAVLGVVPDFESKSTKGARK